MAHAGEIADFTGVSDPYEIPANPEIRLNTEGRAPEESRRDRPRQARGARPRRRARLRRRDAERAVAPLTLSHLDELEAEAIHIMREVAAERERPVLLFSGGKDSIVLLRLAEKAFRPGKFPFPLMHVDTGHNFPEVIEYRDRRVAELGERLVVASVQESIDKGRVVEQTGPARLAQPAADDDAPRRDHRARLRRRDGRRAPRRGEVAREGADLQLPRRLRPVELARPAARALEPLQRPDPQGRADPGLPDLELDRARRVAVHRPRAASSCRRSTSPTNARCSAATGCSTPSPTSSSACRARSPFPATVRFRTVGDMSCTGGVESRAATLDEVVDRDRGHQHHRARRDPRRRPRFRGGDGRPQARRLLLGWRPPSG